MYFRILFILLCTISFSAPAAVIYVDKDAGGNNDGTSWANAYNFLQDALDAAQAADQIWVADGTYYPDDGESVTENSRSDTFQLIQEAGLYGGFNGSEAALADRNWQTNVTILSGNINNAAVDTDNSYHVLKGAQDAVLDGFTITKGYADGSTSLDDYGAGMYNVEIGMTVKNCIFTDNNSQVGTRFGRGGAIYHDECDGVKYIQCTFTANSGKKGGAVYCYKDSNLEFVNCTFQNNYASGGSGGAVFLDLGTDIAFINTVFSGNYTIVQGGAIYGSYVNPLTITNCTLSGNSITQPNILLSPSAGGIFIYNCPTTITNTILWGNWVNSSTDLGAQITKRGSRTLTVTYSCIQDDDENDTSIPFGGTSSFNIDDDPNFVTDPADGGDGWRTGSNDNYGNLHLQSVSPCIDAGTPVALPADTHDLDADTNITEDIPYDLDKNTRQMDGDPNGGATTDMGAFELLAIYQDDIDQADPAVTLNPDGGSNAPLDSAVAMFSNVSGGDDATVDMQEIQGDAHADLGTFEIFGSTVTVNTSLDDGEFKLTVSIPFDEDDIGTTLDPLLVDIKYYNTTIPDWVLAVSGNTGAIGTRYSETGAAPTLAALHARNTGDYGVYWDAAAKKGFAWANVDHTTDFGASLKNDSETDIDVGKEVTLNPGGGNTNLKTDTIIVFENTTSDSNDATLTVSELQSDLHQTTGTYKVVGTTVVVDTSMANGEFQMTLVIPFDDDDVGGGNPLLVDLQYYNDATSSWVLAVAGNTGGAGTRWQETDDDEPDLDTLKTRSLGDYGVYWDTTEEQGFVWANVDHTTDFAAGFIPGDFEPDGDVDIDDLMELVYYWMRTDCMGPDFCSGRDINQDKRVDLSDFAILSAGYKPKQNTD